MVLNQLRHQDTVTSNLHQFTSNTLNILPKPLLWFRLSWGYLIIMPLIMVILRFTLHSIHFNLTQILFQTRIPIQSNQLMMMKWTKYWNLSTQRMMVIFWMLVSIWWSLDYWFLLPQKFIQSPLCRFKIWRIKCWSHRLHVTLFYVLSNIIQCKIVQWKHGTWTMNWYFYVILLTTPLSIQRDKFIVFQATLTIPYHWVT